MRKGRFVATFACTVLLGCGSQVVPGVVVEGTTATIALPYDLDIGYGRAWAGIWSDTKPGYDPNALEDLQRGEMIFRLFDQGQAGPAQKLRLRYITRLARDPASPWAATAEDHLQPIALIDIPSGLVAEDGGSRAMEIEVRRFRRDPAHPQFGFVEVQQSYWTQYSWWGWGSNDGGPGSIHQRIPITVLDSTDEAAHYTPREGWGPNGARDTPGDPNGSNYIRTGIFVQSGLEASVPQPEFRIQALESVQETPFAWQMQVTFPAERMEIRTVRLIRGNASGGIVTWRANPATAPACSGGTSQGTVDISVVDPEPYWAARSRGVAVVFGLANQDNQSCRGPIGDVDVGIASGSYKGYDLSGTELLEPSPFAIVDYDLH